MWGQEPSQATLVVRRRRAVLSALAAMVLCASRLAAAVPPAPTAWVTDPHGFLTPSMRKALDTRLGTYEGQTGRQVLVWAGRSTGGQPIEDYARRAFDAWGVGGSQAHDGVVIFFFSRDRTLRIQVGRGLTDALPNAAAAQIINNKIVPRLKAGDRDGAAKAAVDAILARLDAPTAASAPAAAATAPRAQTSPPQAPAADDSDEEPRGPMIKAIAWTIFIAIMLITLALTLVVIVAPIYLLVRFLRFLVGARPRASGDDGSYWRERYYEERDANTRETSSWGSFFGGSRPSPPSSSGAGVSSRSSGRRTGFSGGGGKSGAGASGGYSGGGASGSW